MRRCRDVRHNHRGIRAASDRHPYTDIVLLAAGFDALEIGALRERGALGPAAGAAAGDSGHERTTQ